MTAAIVMSRMMKDRTKSLIGWSLALVVLILAMGFSYPTIRDTASNIEQFMENMPEGMGEVFGASGGITTPDGYLNSQLYSNMYPILLLIFGIGMAAWTIAGSERDGTLEPLLANPVTRARVALGRYVGLVVILGIAMAISTAVLIALRQPFELSEISASNVAAAGVGSYLLALVFATFTYAVGAAFGRRGIALGVGSGLAAATYIVFVLGAFIEFFENVLWISPWHWYLNQPPISEGWTAQAFLVPFLVIIPLVALGTWRFTGRDLR